MFSPSSPFSSSSPSSNKKKRMSIEPVKSGKTRRFTPSPNIENGYNVNNVIDHSTKNLTYLPVNFSDVNISNERIFSFLKMNEFLDSLPSDEVCSMGKAFNNPVQFSSISSPNANAFRIVTQESIGIASKVMNDTRKSRDEISYYRLFTYKQLKENGLPHFPLVSRCEQCDICSVTKTYNQGKTYIKTPIETTGRCFVLFSELADGSLESIINDMTSSEQVLSMIFQVWMACASLEKMKLVHNDLHLGNILYHSEPAEQMNSGKWLWYRLEDVDNDIFDIYIKHNGSLWVLWDFGLMVKNGSVDPRDTGDSTHIIQNTFKNDISMKFFPDVSRVLQKQMPDTFEVLNDVLAENTSIIEILKLLAYNNYDDMITMTPPSEIINKTPYYV